MANVAQLLRQQKDNGEAIKAKKLKFEQTQIESRTLAYAKARLSSLEAIWGTFCTTHAAIAESSQIDGGHEYFSEGYFEKLEQVYRDFKYELKVIINQHESDQQAQGPNPTDQNGHTTTAESRNQTSPVLHTQNTGNNDPVTPSGSQDGSLQQERPLDRPINLRSLYRSSSHDNMANSGSGSQTRSSHAKFQNFSEAANNFCQTLHAFISRNDDLDDRETFLQQGAIIRKWTIIDKMHQRYMTEDPDYDATPFLQLEKEMDPIIFSYEDTKLRQQGQSIANPPRVELSAKLPKLHVPKFNDDYVKYRSFKQLFMKMVGSRTGLDEVEKFAYLKGQVEGEALRLISALPVENGSYATAWKKLDERFDNKHKIMIKLIEKIVDVKPMKNAAISELKEIVDTISEKVIGLLNMGVGMDDMSNHFLYFHTERKIHPAILRIYENTLTVPGVPRKYEDFIKFLQCRVQNSSSAKHESSDDKTKVPQQNVNKKEKFQKGTALVSSPVQQKSRISQCCCKEKHFLYQCPKFLDLKPDERIKKCRELKRCINCLRDGHIVKNCRGRQCQKCNGRHNTLLHLEKESSTKTALLGSAISNKNFKHVFLATALVQVVDKYGNPVVIRALLDSGSQLNMLTEKAHRKLGLSHNSTNMKISGIGAAAIESHKRSIIQLNSQNSGFKTSLEVFVVKTVTTCQPAQEVDIKSWNIPKNISLADPKFNIPAKVDLIIGGELFYKLLSIGMISIGEDLPDLQNTVFGWVVIGKLLGLEQPEAFVGISIQQSLENQLTQFWKIEEKFQPPSKFTQLEMDCEKYFADTTLRNAANGRFIVKLQFLKEPSVLGRSEEMAIRRFLFLEKKFDKDPDMKSEYVKFMNEYKELGHMEAIERSKLGEKFYMIPHHAVRNPSSSTTKFRVVFDASAKTTTNISLNEILANGPILQDDLFSIMVRFCAHRYVFSADITKMYRQIEVNPEDQKWQIIVWREHPDQPLQYFKLKTLTYGTTCASYLAIKSLQQLAEEHKISHPGGSIVAKRDFNVDDVMTGSDDLYQATRIQAELIDLCEKGDLHLHKWCANHPLLLEAIPKIKQEISLDINTEKTETKALGMKWIPKDDKFKLSCEPKEYKRITKRTVLSETAQLFDPLGLVNPVIVLAKIFLQELWALKLDWDAALPIELHSKWEEFRKELLKLNQVSIPRRMVIEKPINIQLHAFSDASVRAYGTAIYLRSESASGQVQVNLVCSKSRVAPVEATTLPRLELCGGVVMTALAEKLNDILQIKISSITFWTDSEIVLSWIYSDGNYKTFVANRIASIKRKTKIEDWKYINTKFNPADLISRGVLPEKLISSDLWWHGPEFLRKNMEHWPTNKAAFVREPEEERTIKTVLTSFQENDHPIDRINHRNSIKLLQRVVAYMLRFKMPKDNICLHSINDKALNVLLTTDELKNAMTIILKHCQQKHFSTEIELIKKGMGDKTKFSNFVPIIDADGIVRVGGRLHASAIPFEQKHPILLPQENIITRLIMEKLHQENIHAGPQALLAITRQKYWPENGKRLAQSIVKQCILCTKSKPKLMEQLIGVLPADRVTPTRAFLAVGIDLAGPITIHYKLRGKRPTKAYVCIFVCFTTKAIHIEAAADLTTEAFISCIKRFIARRGVPKRIYCDNATNFTSASSQLEELKALMENRQHQHQVIRYCQDHQIEWKFIPPRSPHFGGLHEAAVKSAKLHLKKVLHSVEVTYDELITILAEIEAILNSRPLTPMSNDPNDLQPLTAGHFLIGAPLNCIYERDLPLTSKTKMWTKINMLKQEFWTRWNKEYLSELQQPNKWLKSQENISVGTLVILKENNIPPLHWKMGRITHTIADNFGKVRVVKVKTSTGEFKRAIHEIAPLPVSTGSNQQITEQIPDITHVVPAERQKRNVKNVASAHVKIHNLPSKTPRTKKRLNPAAAAFEPRVTRSKTNKNCTTPTAMMMMISMFMALIIAAIGQPCDVLSFNSNPGLYYESQGQLSLTSDEWNIICYIQLSDYWNQSITIKALLEQLDEICPQLEPTEQCNITRKQLKTQLSVIHAKNELIRGFSHARKRRERSSIQQIETVNTLDKNETENLNKLIDNAILRTMAMGIGTHHEAARKSLHNLTRKKRAWINFLGTGLKTITGVLDDDDAKQYDDKIESLKSETKHLLQLIGNQTTIQEITQNIIKRDETGISHQLTRMENEISTLRNKEATAKTDTFNALALQAVVLINNHISIQNELIELITQTHHGKVSTNILTPSQLRQHMIAIAANISKDLMVPGDDHKENIAKIYATLSAQIRVTTTKIVVKIRMPLLHREFFKLYHMLPVPFVQANDTLSIIQLTHQYIGINDKQDHYYMLTQQQKSECNAYSDELIICPQNHPLHNTQSGSALCEMAIFSHQSKGIPPKCVTKQIFKKQVWSKLNTPNHFMFTVTSPAPINIICKDASTACSINGSGIINLPQRCLIQSGNIEISAHNIYNSESPALIVPGINITDVLQEIRMKQRIIPNSPHQDSYEPDPDLALLDAAIISQKFGENSSPAISTNWHNVHHYFATYIIFMVIAIFITWYIHTQKLCCFTRLINNRRSRPVMAEDIEMVLPMTSQPIPTTRSNVHILALPRDEQREASVSFSS